MLVEAPSKSRKCFVTFPFWAENNAALRENITVSILDFVFINRFFLDDVYTLADLFDSADFKFLILFLKVLIKLNFIIYLTCNLRLFKPELSEVPP